MGKATVRRARKKIVKNIEKFYTKLLSKCLQKLGDLREASMPPQNLLFCLTLFKAARI